MSCFCERLLYSDVIIMQKSTTEFIKYERVFPEFTDISTFLVNLMNIFLRKITSLFYKNNKIITLNTLTMVFNHLRP